MKKIVLTLLSLCFVAVLSAQVSKTVIVVAGGLSTALTDFEKANIKDLTASGTIDARDFKTMRDSMPNLAKIDLSEAKIVKYNGYDGTYYNHNYFIKYNYDENTIPHGAFSKSSVGKKTLTDIILAKTTIKIDAGAFKGCINLRQCKFNTSLEEIGVESFYECAKLENIFLNDSLKIIGSSAFERCISIDGTIIIHKHITEVGLDAFYECTNIDTLKYYASGRMGQSAFEGCTQLEYLEINSKTIIGTYGFKFCTKLKNVQLLGGVSSIYTSAFSGCANLETITIPQEMTHLGGGVFKGCKKLKEITITGTLNKIFDNTFQGCSSLEKFIIPNDVTEIGDKAFEGCSSLKSVSLPYNLTYLGSNVFNYCSKINEIFAPWNIPINLNSNIFSSLNQSNCILYVPEGTKKDYENKNYWSYFYIIEGNGFLTDKDSLIFKPNSSLTQQLEIRSNSNWEVINHCKWLSSSDTIGFGNKMIQISVQENVGNNERNDSLIIILEGNKYNVIGIKQQATPNAVLNYKSDSKVKLYPNPFSKEIFIYGVNDDEILEIINDAGKIFMQVKLNNNASILDLNDLPKGCYVFNLLKVRHSYKIMKL